MKPKLLIKKSNKNIYAELLDESGKVLAAADSKKIKEKINLTEKAKIIGKTIAQEAKKKKITECIFLRRCYRYHGRVAALVDGARQEGLKI